MPKTIKVLVITEDYPNDIKVPLMYVHTRNKYYASRNINVIVLNFRAKENYTIDGINVITLKHYKNSNDSYDLLISHAPNIRHHLLFLLKNGNRFKRYLFFFHGHEVLRKKTEYPIPYKYVSRNVLIELISDAYDLFKLKIWNSYLPRIMNKSYLVFVSNWMYKKFLEYTKISEDVVKDKYTIIYNSIGREFEENRYDSSRLKKYDYVTIRSNLDGSKYCIDVLNNFAKLNPDKKFLLIGTGNYFNHYDKADNIEWENRNLKHDEIIKVLNKSKCAFMPTRTDSQGVMVCEMMSFGIPVITSDIEICHEIFDGNKNVSFIDNENLNLIDNIIKESKREYDDRFYQENTIAKEVELINNILSYE